MAEYFWVSAFEVPKCVGEVEKREGVSVTEVQSSERREHAAKAVVNCSHATNNFGELYFHGCCAWSKAYKTILAHHTKGYTILTLIIRTF